MELKLDFSELSVANGDYPDNTSQSEIISVVNNPNYRLSEIPHQPKNEFRHYICGYSNKKRILLIAARIIAREFDKRIETQRQILQVRVANEEEIDFFYCGK